MLLIDCLLCQEEKVGLPVIPAPLSDTKRHHDRTEGPDRQMATGQTHHEPQLHTAPPEKSFPVWGGIFSFVSFSDAFLEVYALYADIFKHISEVKERERIPGRNHLMTNETGLLLRDSL